MTKPTIIAGIISEGTETYPGITVTSVRVEEVVSVDHTMILVEFVTVTVIVVEFVTVTVIVVEFVTVTVIVVEFVTVTVIVVEFVGATPSTLAAEVVVVVARTSMELNNRRAHTNMRAYRARVFMD
jgi:hypothetical protein